MVYSDGESMLAILLGLLIGVRHAFEPDHLAAIATLLDRTPNARRGALVGALWGLGHTLSLLVVGILLLAVGSALPEGLARAFEIGVALMLIALGARAIVGALRAPAGAPTPHAHGELRHSHATLGRHVHVANKTLAVRPLAIGLVHGLAGSGALTALVFAELPDAATRLGYIALFGLGSVLGMALASGLAGLALGRASAASRRGWGFAMGGVSIAVGIWWGAPLVFG